MGLDPLNIIDSLRRLLLRVWDMGFDAIRWLWRYLSSAPALSCRSGSSFALRA
jgi:hypothetical protein